MSDDYSQTARHRGVDLPAGMTPACLDELSELINMHAHEDNEECSQEAAIRAFLIVQRNRA